jgi:hypothetical protein
MKYIIIIISIALIYSCNNSSTVENSVTAPVVANSEALQMLPLLPENLRVSLFESTDYIDYIFYPYGRSINQGDKSSVRQMIQQITDIQQSDVNCAAPFCKVSFYKMPNVLLEAEVHYGNGCAYFVFHDSEGKPQYANKVGELGITFFNQVITGFEGKKE